MSNKDFVLAVLPNAYAFQGWDGGPWSIYAADGCPALVTGAKNEAGAWLKAARVLGAKII
jgi:hypothetical protein